MTTLTYGEVFESLRGPSILVENMGRNLGMLYFVKFKALESMLEELNSTQPGGLRKEDVLPESFVDRYEEFIRIHKNQMGDDLRNND